MRVIRLKSADKWTTHNAETEEQVDSEWNTAKANVVVVIKSKYKSIYINKMKPIDGGINITLQKSYKNTIP